MDNIVRRTEAMVHQILIANLPSVAMYTVIQDPGHVRLLVINRDGLATGTLPNGRQVHDIPESFVFYSEGNPAVILHGLQEGEFQVILTGAKAGDYELVVTSTLPNLDAPQASFQGVLTEGARVAYQVSLSAQPTMPRQNVTTSILLPGDINGDEKLDCRDVKVINSAWGKRNGQMGFNRWADGNADGLVGTGDFILGSFTGACLAAPK